MNKITYKKIISITILAEDENGKRFNQELLGEEAEKWLAEVDGWLNEACYYTHKRLDDFPDFNWTVNYFQEKGDKNENR